jgi:hypothetical protein
VRWRAFLIALSVVAVAQPLEAHPLHTSLADITYDASAKEMRISVRVFIDDFTRASAAYAAARAAAARAAKSSVSSESPLLMYARASFVIADRNGRVLSLASCGGKRVGDLMWICFHTPSPADLSGFRVADKILFDLYADQINIVQATNGDRKVSLLFTRGDGFKRLD